MRSPPLAVLVGEPGQVLAYLLRPWLADVHLPAYPPDTRHLTAGKVAGE
jgi:hypothetical protein